jgi:hypothetical protein
LQRLDVCSDRDRFNDILVASALGPGKELLDLICLVTFGIILRDFGLAEHHGPRSTE